MVSNAQIIKKNYFPRIILPVSNIMVTLFDFLMAAMIFIFLLVYYYFMGMQVSILAIAGYFIAGFVLTVITTTGMSLIISAFNAKYRDFRYMIPFLIQLLFFLSPVIYPMSVFENSPISYLLAINPMSSALDLVRTPFTGLAPDLVHLMISTGAAVVLLVTGLQVFQKMEAYFADII
jgi:lipopolysaccharide transport system permease protein